MPELIYFYITSNNLDELPDVSVPGTLIDFLASDNNFSFEDIESNMDLIPGTNFIYSPQDSIGENQTFIKNDGEAFTYSLVTGGTQNSYQWYRNGELLDSQTDAMLDLGNVTLADGGYYYCEVTNSLVPGLTLTSKKISLLINGQIQIALNTGWNIFSAPVLPDDSNLKNILQPLIDAGLLKKVMDESGNAIEDWGIYGGWKNIIGDMQRAEGYKINVTSATLLDLEGIASQLPFEIQLASGWNIISWPSDSEQEGIAVFQDLIDAGMLKKVMNESGEVIEDWGIYGGWKNFIGNLKPGEGYKVNVTNSAVLTVNDSNVKLAVRKPEKALATYFKPVFEGNGIDHMSINLIHLKESGIMEGDEIGIFDGDLCVGALKLIGQNLLSSVNLIASADDNDKLANGFFEGDNIHLKLYRDGKEYPLKLNALNNSFLQFEKNGTIFLEAQLDLNTDVTLQKNILDVSIYPNPFSEILTIEINLPIQQDLTVELFDINSRKIRQLYIGKTAGNIKLNWNGRDSKGNRVAQGIYFCRINNKWEKVILRNN